MGYEPVTECDFCGEPFDAYRAPEDRVCDGCQEMREARAAFHPDPSITELRVVCDGPPGPEGGRFVEVEDRSGASIRAGDWHQRQDGLWELVIVVPFHIHQATSQFDDDTCGLCGHDLRHSTHFTRSPDVVA